MSIHELPAGFYKIKRRRDAYMSRRKGTFFMGSIHIMQVKHQNGGKMICIDNGPEYTVHYFLEQEGEDFEVIKRIGEFPQINRPRITLTWQDEQGDEFKLTVADAWSLRNIFDKFRFLAAPFNFRPKNKS
jgi:hypothetical protein